MHRLGEKRPSSPSQTNQRWEDQSKSLETVVSAKGENPPGGNREEPPSRKERRQEKNPLVEKDKQESRLRGMQQQLDPVKSEMKGKYEVLGLRQLKREDELSFQTFFYLNS